MKAEIIAVGTELLLGQIVNTNAQYISQGLAGLGIDVYFQTVVGDNETRLTQALQIAKERAQLIILTGGLGPTQDDLTKDVVAAFVGHNLVMHQPSMDKITAFFQARGSTMVESNARQALMIEGSTPLWNETGQAVGIAITYDETHFILLPGPPREMKPMFDNHVKPWLRSVMTDEVPLYSKMLKFAGIGESGLEHQLIDLIKDQQDPTIAPYAKEGEVTIRLTTRANSEDEAFAKMMGTEQEIRRRVGQYIFAEEDVSITDIILQIMKQRNVTLSVAESCTGGLVSDMLTAIPGSSEVFRGGVICYSNAVKSELLGVPLHLLEGDNAPGAISSEAAAMLAEQMIKISKTDYAISITGVAGPSTSESKPVGLVYIGIAHRDGSTRVEKVQLSGNRESIKLKAAKQAFYFLWQQLR